MATLPIYEFYAELRDYEPKIWRRFQVMENVTVARLGYIVMTMFEMQASHLFHIAAPAGENFLNYNMHSEGRRADQKTIQGNTNPDTEKMYKEIAEKLGIYIYRIPGIGEEDFPNRPQYHIKDATYEKLKHAVSHEGDALCLRYDYGDGWEVILRLEKVFTDDELPGKELPRVLKGEGYGIIENCGGPGGLQDLAETFERKQGEEYRELSRWLGQTELDLTAFDLDDMNFRLKKVPRIYRDLYELDYEPTLQSQKLLNREYKKI